MGLGLVLMMPAAFGKERAGAHLKLVRIDGAVVEGELLTVKGRELILRTYSGSEGVTAAIDGLAEVRIVRRARALKGLGKGFLIGGVSGAGLGALCGGDGAEHADEWLYIGPRNAAEGALGGALIVGTLGALVGVVAGALGGNDTVYRIQGASASSLNAALSALNRRSRRPS